jgi:hypothetical protein
VTVEPGPTIPEASTVEEHPQTLIAGKLYYTTFQSRNVDGTALTHNHDDTYQMDFFSDDGKH